MQASSWAHAARHPINAPANHRARLCSLIKACFRAPRNLTLRYTHKQMDDFLADMCDTPGAAAAEPEGESDMLTMGDVMEEAGGFQKNQVV